MKKRIKINGVIIGLGAALVIMFPRVFFRGSPVNFLGQALRVLGVVVVLLGQIIRVSARGYKSENSQNSHVLIQNGPYQVVRNPMYLGILLIGSGVVLILFKIWAIIIFLLVFIARYLLLISQEEQKLTAMFPGTYSEYCKKTPCLLPSISRISKLGLSDYLPIKLSWFKKELNSILPLLFAVILAASWEGILKTGVSAYFQGAIWIFCVIFLFIILVVLLSRRPAQGNETKTNKG